MTHRDTVCVLCGLNSPDVSVALIAWKQPIGSAWFTSAPRRRDHGACRGRVELHGETWDVRDPAPRPTKELVTK